MHTKVVTIMPKTLTTILWRWLTGNVVAFSYCQLGDLWYNGYNADGIPLGMHLFDFWGCKKTTIWVHRRRNATMVYDSLASINPPQEIHLF